MFEVFERARMLNNEYYKSLVAHVETAMFTDLVDTTSSTHRKWCSTQYTVQYALLRT